MDLNLKKKRELLGILIIASFINLGSINVMGSEQSTDDTKELSKKISNIQVEEDNPIELDDTLIINKDDTEAPVVEIESLEVSKNDVKPGDKVKISLKVDDKLSGVQVVKIYYFRPISKNSQDIDLKYNETTGKYEGEFPITEETQSGIWKVLRIFVQDNNYNCEFIYNKDVVEDASGEIVDLSKGNIKVSETNVTSKDDVDMIGPTIYEDTVSVDKSYVEKGDKVKVSLKAADKSGISRITVNYQELTGGEFRHVDLEFNKETGYFEGYINIDDNFKEGTYRIWDIMAVDNENNTTVLYGKDATEWGTADLLAGNFIVGNEVVDTEAPILYLDTLSVEKINLTKNEYKIGIEAQVDPSGIKNVEATFKCNETNELVKYKLIPENYPSAGKYSCVISNLNNNEEKTFTLVSLSAEDNANNKVEYSAENYDFSKYSFKVEREKEAPKIDLSSIKVSKEVVLNEQAKISLKTKSRAEDIEYIRVKYIKPESKESVTSQLKYNKETQEFEGYIDATEKGEWKIDSIWSSSGKIMEILFSLDSENKLPFKKVDLSMGNFEVR